MQRIGGFEETYNANILSDDWMIIYDVSHHSADVPALFQPDLY